MAGAALDAIARLARVRERTVAELRLRLETRGYEPDEIEGALKRARALGYVDDARAAHSLVERWQARGASRAFLEDKLEASGVAEALAREALREVPNERALALAALDRRYRGQPAPRGRQARFLASKGYDEALIADLLGGD